MRLHGVGHRRLGVRLALQDPPVEGRGGSLCGEWPFCQRFGDEGPGWDAAPAEQSEVPGPPDDAGVVVQALTQGAQLRDAQARYRGQELPVELVLVVPRGSGLRASSGGVAVLRVDVRGGSPHGHIAEQVLWEFRAAECPARGRGLQRVEADLCGDGAHVLGAGVEVRTPAFVVGNGGRDAGEPGEGPSRAFGDERGQESCRVCDVLEAEAGCDPAQLIERGFTVGGREEPVPQSWPGAGGGEPWYDIVGSMVEDLQLGGVVVLEGDGQRVAVPVDRVREPHGGVVGVRDFAGDGAGGAVPGEYGFEDLDGGGWTQRLWHEGGVGRRDRRW